jgi:hypothetical protein
MRQVHARVGPERLVAVEHEALAVLEQLLVAFEAADAQLRPLQVGEDGGRPLQLLFEAADDLDPGEVIGSGCRGSC